MSRYKYFICVNRYAFISQSVNNTKADSICVSTNNDYVYDVIVTVVKGFHLFYPMNVTASRDVS